MAGQNHKGCSGRTTNAMVALRYISVANYVCFEFVGTCDNLHINHYGTVLIFVWISSHLVQYVLDHIDIYAKLKCMLCCSCTTKFFSILVQYERIFFSYRCCNLSLNMKVVVIWLSNIFIEYVSHFRAHEVRLMS